MNSIDTAAERNRWGALPTFLAMGLACVGLIVGLRSFGVGLPLAVGLGFFAFQMAIAPISRTVDDTVAKRSPLGRLFLPLMARNFWLGYVLHAAVVALLAAGASTFLLR